MTNKHDIIWLKSVDSTNNEARRRFSEIDNLSVLSAELQTAGRGQRGNIWYSLSGENLTFSIVLKFAIKESDSLLPRLKASDQFTISEITALSVVDFLARSGIEANIKWPNDIYVGNRKICGILIENFIRGDMVSGSIVGIGLNVNQMTFDPDLPNPTSMALCLKEKGLDDHKSDIKTIIHDFMKIFRKYLDQADRPGTLRQSYLEKMWLLGESAQFIDTSDNKEFTGKIRGLSDVGNLLVELPDCSVKEFGFREISYLLSSKRSQFQDLLP